MLGGSILFYNMMSENYLNKKIIGIDVYIPNELKKELKKCGNKLCYLKKTQQALLSLKKLKILQKDIKVFSFT